ncbi:MAG TPA: pyridoxamine 5'-phosphate oxidase family protein [Propionicimonas sp.]|nr:pyridoxamine 5'-phosphate oxidase family protein [Propionicimonas sp.]HQA76871.1 pyridoxamine 5'-phosphate oxidase family protein [Propionicimonas sp.]HQD97307.1 pyridoxamine 5'-phosphate oxidase family protein [Propionicimonas sp.]
MDTAGHFTRPSGEECRQLVRSHCVGRVAWLAASGLQVLPVTYGCHDDRIFFRVNPASVMGELADDVEVAFEVDDIDVDTATGWSVLVHGVAADHDGSAQPVLPAPWAPDHSGLTIVITPSTYSGRAVSAAVERN